MNENGRNYLNTREAAAWLGLSPRTLDRYRVSGEGPVFHRFGSRVRYLLADIEAWASARRRVSTSDDGGALALGEEYAMRKFFWNRHVLAALVWALWRLEAAWATTDTTFSAPLDTVSGIVAGTGGQLAAALAVGAALVGSVLRFNAAQLAGAVGVGIAAGAGTGIVTGLVGTAII